MDQARRENSTLANILYGALKRLLELATAADWSSAGVSLAGRKAPNTIVDAVR